MISHAMNQVIENLDCVLMTWTQDGEQSMKRISGLWWINPPLILNTELHLTTLIKAGNYYIQLGNNKKEDSSNLQPSSFHLQEGHRGITGPTGCYQQVTTPSPHKTAKVCSSSALAQGKGYSDGLIKVGKWKSPQKWNTKNLSYKRNSSL